MTSRAEAFAIRVSHEHVEAMRLQRFLRLSIMLQDTEIDEILIGRAGGDCFVLLFYYHSINIIS
jgi:hypothetical protein